MVCSLITLAYLVCCEETLRKVEPKKPKPRPGRQEKTERYLLKRLRLGPPRQVAGLVGDVASVGIK